ncbi:MAG: hypothetical protein JWR34_1795 [Mycobacterium sp.]|nr:hypothetical protein [Mycobacterium sp.]
MNLQQIEHRERALKTWGAELHNKVKAIEAKGGKAADVKTITPEFRDWEAERDLLKSSRESNAASAKMRGYGDSGSHPTVVGKCLTGAQVNPLAFSEASLKTLYNAVQTRQSVGVKAFSTLESLLPNQLDGSILTKFLHENRVLNYLPTQSIQAPSHEIIVHSSSTGAATPVAEGAQKPEIVLNTTALTVTAVKLACHVAVSYEAAMDFDGFVGYVQGEVMAQLQDVENAQILNGSGSGGNMTGFLNTSGILTHDFSADPGGFTSLDAVESSIAQLRVSSALAEPDIFIVHPTTWAAMRRTKTTQGAYVLNDPSQSAVNSLWGVRAIVTTALAAGAGLLIDTQKACKVYVRENITSHVGTNNDDFTKNIHRMVLEERLVLGVNRPAAVLSITNLPTS